MGRRGRINKVYYVLSRFQKRRVFIFSLLILLPIGLVGCGLVLPKESSGPTGSVAKDVAPAAEMRDNVVPESSYYAANPELNAAQRYTAIVKDEASERVIPESSYYAANPELSAAQRYTAIVKSEASNRVIPESSYYAANPELNAAHRYTAIVKDQRLTDSAFYAANPEVMAARRYTNRDN